MKFIEIMKQNKPAIQELSNLATTILKEHYDPIIGARQNDYMIKKFQSVDALTKQFEQNYHYYFVCDEVDEKVGFVGYYPRENDLYLSKFYLKKNHRGKGIAKEMFEFIKNQAKQLDYSTIVLNVNKNNAVAIRAYEKLGMIKIDQEKIDIGNSYYMDDYVYQYLIK
ncbi:GNAT family N-acetyltransferase [Amphibacillus indicireducens]|uniref:N-acetyltransferase domain-containing protein n=1 Tax=Amphibacillus indicireducens TaxID=1076330 RepID=A0ABP7VP07_9BACI